MADQPGRNVKHMLAGLNHPGQHYNIGRRNSITLAQFDCVPMLLSPTCPDGPRQLDMRTWRSNRRFTGHAKLPSLTPKQPHAKPLPAGLAILLLLKTLTRIIATGLAVAYATT